MRCPPRSFGRLRIRRCDVRKACKDLQERRVVVLAQPGTKLARRQPPHEVERKLRRFLLLQSSGEKGEDEVPLG